MRKSNSILPTSFAFLMLAWVLAIAGCDDPVDRPGVRASEAGEEKATQATSAGGSQHYSLTSPDEAVTVGEKANVEVAIEASGDLKPNEEFPWSVDFAESENVQLARDSFAIDAIEFGEKEATLSLLVEVDQPGEHQLEASGDFSVCTDTECFVMRDEPLDFVVRAEDDQ